MCRSNFRWRAIQNNKYNSPLKHAGLRAINGGTQTQKKSGYYKKSKNDNL